MAVKVESMTDAEIESIAEAFVRAGVRMGWLYATSERREGYIIFYDSGTSPSIPALMEVIRGCLKSLGLKGVSLICEN
ncbi:MAG: hypothetical protein NC429_08355 [Lachnospiraceae bacterium]|nr:hypothetical protein [Lachnospiraceae bacterium]